MKWYKSIYVPKTDKPNYYCEREGEARFSGLCVNPADSICVATESSIPNRGASSREKFAIAGVLCLFRAMKNTGMVLVYVG